VQASVMKIIGLFFKYILEIITKELAELQRVKKRRKNLSQSKIRKL
jgi:hypothetical protein